VGGLPAEGLEEAGTGAAALAGRLGFAAVRTDHHLRTRHQGALPGLTGRREGCSLTRYVGLFLPCRITVVEQGGKVSMMAANPKRLSRLFNNSELNRMCDEMTRMYRTIMDDATL